MMLEAVEEIGSKICPKCKNKKSLDKYGRKRRQKGNWVYLSWCRDCYKANNRSEKRRKYNQEWIKKNKYYHRELPCKKRNAKATALAAVRRGVLKKLPCEVCGSKDSRGHHEDYSKPLEVRWLCGEHHRELHLKAIHTEMEKRVEKL